MRVRVRVGAADARVHGDIPRGGAAEEALARGWLGLGVGVGVGVGLGLGPGLELGEGLGLG